MRDLRDPQKLGQMLKAIRDWNPDCGPLSQVIDHYKDSMSKVDDYPQDESMATVTAREYRQELQERAAEGDKYAASMLKGEPNDEPIS